jgi:hypothetical protein
MTRKELLDCLNHRTGILNSLNYLVIWTGVSSTSPTALLGCLNRHPAMLDSLNYPVIWTGVSLTSPTALLGCLNRHPAILDSLNYLVIWTGVSSMTRFDNHLSYRVRRRVLIGGLTACPYSTPLPRFPARLSDWNNQGVN